MKKMMVIVVLLFSVQTQAQIPVLEIIKAGVKKAITAVDLKIQRLQNKTIWLQNAQKTLENTMSKLKLTQIGDWMEKQRKLYDDYFRELSRARAALAYYHRVKDIIESQTGMVSEYRSAWALLRQDKNFTPEELDYIYAIYTGMVEESLKSIDQLFLVISAFATQMSDAKRLEIINTVWDNIERHVMDLRQFNYENKMISLQRAAEKGEIETVKRLYGL